MVLLYLEQVMSNAIGAFACFVVDNIHLFTMNNRKKQGPQPTPSLLAMSSLTLSVLAIITSLNAVVVSANELDLEGHWQDLWDLGPGVVATLPFDASPDPRASFRGASTTGSIDIGNGEMIMNGKPRYYIDNSAIGWRNVEFTGYATWMADGKLNSASGFTLGARSSHDLYRDDGCEAFGYYAKIYRQTSECAFLKEYYHNHEDNDTMYGRSWRVPCLQEEDWTESREIGIKFTVTTLVDDTHRHANGAVELRLYFDKVGDGTWELVHEFVDEPGKWPPTGGRSVPESCPFENGDTVLGAGNVCFFRADGSMETQCRWRNGSIANRFAFCTETREACNEDLDCCSGQCDAFGYCEGLSLVPYSHGQWRTDYMLRAKARQGGRTKKGKDDTLI